MAERGILRNHARTSHADYVVKELHDRAEIRELLLPRVEYTAYALGQLEPGLFERSRWFRAHGDTGSGLVLHSRGGLGDAMFVSGDPGAVGAILSIQPGPGQTYATCQPQHVDELRRVYRLANTKPMIRMGVTPATFRPVESGTVIPLTGLDIRRINQLYSTEGGSSYYAAEHIEGGVYKGVVVGGRLAAVAGTHVVSRQEQVAVVGNVFTDPRHRGQGFATACTSAVTAQLLEHCTNVVLTVDPDNSPAVAAYRRLGYQEVCQLVEASATRRDMFGFWVSVRRLRAAIAGRSYDGAFVTLRHR
jgi:RimJ/RimL family protein N-acetyltransferase